MNQIRMIVTDLDRTLLRTDKSISPYTRAVLRACQSRGLKVVFATARPLRKARQFLAQVPADAAIVHNGAATFLDGKLIERRGIDPAVARGILLAIARDFPQATLSAEIGDTLYANFDVPAIWDWNQAAAVRTDFSDLPNCPADKLIVGVSSVADMERFSAYLPENLYIQMSDSRLGMIMRRDATKQGALAALCARFGIEIGQAVAFGDDYNDMEMQRACGVGVAMANALCEVKAAADAVCESNDRDGVARWLEENLLARECPGVLDELDISAVIAETGALIRRSFLTVAEQFGLTRENCPSHPAFVCDEGLLSQLKEAYCIGFFQAGELAGFAALVRRKDGYELSRVAVAPEKRHLGYGRRLVAAAVKKARDMGLKEIQIGIIDEHAVLKDWYLAQGFELLPARRYPSLPFTVRPMRLTL